ncbi:MAG: hypothetical protein HYZ75_09055 [Elusimicrobia bacterium]|nr:hypothetical protein [Elusimicrobiota bacterium]
MLKTLSLLLLLAPAARAQTVKAPTLRGTLPVVAPVWAVGPSWTPSAASSLIAPSLAVPALSPVLPALALPVVAIPRVVAAQAAAELPSARKEKTVVASLEASVRALGRPAAAPGRVINAIYDGPSRRAERAEEEALVEVRRERKAEVLVQAHAKRETLDYRRGSFSGARAAEFAAKPVRVSGEKAVTGRDILQLAMTPHAVHLDVPVDAERSDLGVFGVSDAQLREKAVAQGIQPYAAVIAALEDAFLQGLVYRLYDEKNGRTLYGVPYAVRAALDLKAPEAPQAAVVVAEKTGPSPLGRSALDLLAKIDAAADRALSRGSAASAALGAADAELKEYALQLAVAAVEARQLTEADLPAGTMERWRNLRLGSSPFSSTLLTVLETAHGGPFFAEAKALARQAADAGLVLGADLDALLRELR